MWLHLWWQTRATWRSCFHLRQFIARTSIVFELHDFGFLDRSGARSCMRIDFFLIEKRTMKSRLLWNPTWPLQWSLLLKDLPSNGWCFGSSFTSKQTPFMRFAKRHGFRYVSCVYPPLVQCSACTRLKFLHRDMMMEYSSYFIHVVSQDRRETLLLRTRIFWGVWHWANEMPFTPSPVGGCRADFSSVLFHYLIRQKFFERAWSYVAVIFVFGRNCPETSISYGEGQ